MQLFGSFTSPFVRHCRIALLQSGLEFDFIETDHATSARQSPTKKVPYLSDGELALSDSSTILKYIREKSGGQFLTDIEDFEIYAMSNTVLDSAINLFLLQHDGVTPATSPYLKRQQQRVDSGLSELDRRLPSADPLSSDGQLRCACLLDWGLFRQRFGLAQLDNLTALLARANAAEHFTATAPPGAHK